MTDDTPDDNESDAGRPESFQEMFQRFAEVSKEQDRIDEDTAESFKRFTQGTESDEDRETLMDAVESWIGEAQGESSKDE